MVEPMMLVEYPFHQKTFLTVTTIFSSLFSSMVGNIMSDGFFLVKKRFSHLLHFEFMVQPMMFIEFPFRQKTFLTFTALRVHGTPHDVCWIYFSSKKRFSHSMHVTAHDVSSLFPQKTFSHKLHFEFMVQPMMSDEFLFRQKTFLALTALRVHGREHNVWWILSRQKTFITFTALRVHGTPHNVRWIPFPSKTFITFYP